MKKITKYNKHGKLLTVKNRRNRDWNQTIA
jgi:hypothetical protein